MKDFQKNGKSPMTQQPTTKSQNTNNFPNQGSNVIQETSFSPRFLRDFSPRGVGKTTETVGASQITQQKTSTTS